jgi:nicotinate dehydrogenase subunit A
MDGRFEISVNGAARSVEADGDTALLYVLRNALGLKGSRFGCGHEQCGACMILIDGEPAYACTLPLSAAAGKRVTTIEGLGTADAPHALQQAFLAEQAGQCGYCLSGILISAVALLDENPAPSRAEVAAALEPHLCRCGAHNRIVRAVLRAAAALRGEAVPA